MARKVKVKTKEVIIALEENKAQHIEDYQKAKILYKEQGLKQIVEIAKSLENGETGLKFSLVEPVNKTEWYNNKIRMFEMEVEDVVELEQHEFESLVLDKDSEIASAKFSNMFYSKF